MILSPQDNTKGYILIFCLFAFVFLLAWIHHYKFMKSEFYLKKIKPKSYRFEVLFYLFVVGPILVLSILGFTIVLVKVLNIE